MSLKQISLKEVAEHNNVVSLWIALDNKVYDITKFLTEHPGGCEVMLEQAGKDATEIFTDVGHSTDARAMKEEYLIGEIVEAERKVYSTVQKKKENTDKGSNDKKKTSGSIMTSDTIVTSAIIAVSLALIIYLFLV